MPTKEVMMETVDTAAQEVVKNSDKTGALYVGLGFLAGTALTVGVIKVAKKIEKTHSEKKAKKANPQVAVAAAEVK